jgi:hypothetical protein
MGWAGELWSNNNILNGTTERLATTTKIVILVLPSKIQHFLTKSVEICQYKLRQQLGTLI